MTNKYTIEKIISNIHVFWTYIENKLNHSNIECQSNKSINNGGKIYKNYLNLIDHQISKNGKEWTCKRFKQLHSAAEKIATGRHFTPIPWCKTDKKGIPTELREVYYLLISSNADLKRFGLTVTRSYLKIRLDPVLDLSSIEDGPLTKIKEESINKFKWFIKTDHTLLEPAFQEKPDSSKEYRCSLAVGPNGPSVGTCGKDAKAIVGTPLHDSLRTLSQYTGTEWIVDSMEKYVTNWDGNWKTGRIALLSQPGGKTRTIAIGDFWSQNVLLPLHDRIMKKLRGFKTDGTYDQDLQVLRIIRESRGHKTYCFDLSNATDRFPIFLQEIILAKMFGEGFAHAWISVMVNRSFSYKDKYVKWKVGQPLGMLSSWAVFALTHHYVIRFCAYEEGYHTFNEYAVLGDDVCIWNQKVALRYKEFMNEYGITINIDKSTISEESPHIIEFAKRLFYEGEEISGLGYDILVEGATPKGFVDLFAYAITRSWPLTGSLITPAYIRKTDVDRINFSLNLKIYGIRPLLLGKGNGFCIDLIKRLEDELLKSRLIELRKKIDTYRTVLATETPVQKLFFKEGIELDMSLIKSDSPWLNHPAISQMIKTENALIALIVKLARIKLFGIQSDEDRVTIDSIEYIPTISLAIYFGKRQLRRNTEWTDLQFKVYDNLEPCDRSVIDTFTYSGGTYALKEGKISFVPFTKNDS